MWRDWMRATTLSQGRGRASASLFMACVAAAIVVAVVCGVIACMRSRGRHGPDTFDNATPYLSTLHVTSRTDDTVVWLPPSSTPCVQMIRLLQAIPVPLTPAVITGPLGPSVSSRGLVCTDLVSMFSANVSSRRDCVVAACPGADLLLTVVGCLGSGIPSVPVTSMGTSLYDVARGGGTILCAGQVEQALLRDIGVCATPPIELKTSLVDGGPVDTDTRVFAFLRPRGNTDVLAALSRPQSVTIFFPTLDAGRFSIRQPLARLTGNGGGASVISSTAVLAGSLDLDADPRVMAVVEALTNADPFRAVAELNMASRFLTILPSTREVLRPIDAAARARARSERRVFLDDIGIPVVPILARDGFVGDSPPVTLISELPVQGYLTNVAQGGRLRVFEARSPFIGAARMRMGDRVILDRQPNVQHDGQYIVLSLASPGRGTALVSAFTATYDARSFRDAARVGLVEQGDGDTGVMNVDIGDLLDPDLGHLQPPADVKQDDLLLLRNLDGGRGIWTTVRLVRGKEITLVLTKDEHTAASDGSCITSPTTEIQSVCTGAGGIWDAPCSSDDQCPYYQENTHYPNYRGGCKESGWCEMPLGVQQLSYRTAQGTPTCHGLDGPCRPDDPSPDLAFPLDQYERGVFRTQP